MSVIQGEKEGCVEQPRFHDCLVTGPKFFSSARAKLWMQDVLEVSFRSFAFVFMFIVFKVFFRLRNDYSAGDESSFKTHLLKFR